MGLWGEHPHTIAALEKKGEEEKLLLSTWVR